MRTWLDIEASAWRPRPRPAGAPPSGPVHVALHGPLTMMTIARQEGVLCAVVAESAADVLLDLTQVTETSAAGLRMVDYLRSVLERQGRTLTVVSGDPELRRRFPARALAAAA
jgi:MFS superfamily sulfate permease-like transporter